MKYTIEPITIFTTSEGAPTACILVPPYLNAPNSNPENITPIGLLFAINATAIPSNPYPSGAANIVIF